MTSKALLSVWAVMALWTTLAVGARAEEPEVELLFKKGVELYREADFHSAAVEFRRAYEKSHNYKILYNLAQCEYQLTDYVAALETFDKYLREGGAGIDEQRRREVEAERPTIRSRIAALTVQSRTAGAKVTVDDREVGVTPLAEAVLLNPGSHRVSLLRDGYLVASRSIDVVGGETPMMELEPASAPPTAPSHVPPDDPAPSWTPAVVAWSATGVFAASAVVFGALASGRSHDLKNAKDTPGASASELSNLDSEVKTLALVTDVAIVGTAAGGIIATFLTVDRIAKARRVRVEATLGGLRLAGSF